MTKMMKSLLLGTAAGLVAVAGAQAADMPVKAAPVQYVKICSLYGDGFYYIPGTDTCLKMGGYLRVQAEYNMGGGGVVAGDQSGSMLGQARFDRVDTNDINYRVRGAISWDVRQQTEYGTLRTYIRFGAENTTPANTGAGTTFNPFWDRAFIQFAGFTVGRSQSFFDLVTYGGAYSYHNVRVSGDTGAAGQNLWAYTAQFGNGFSGTISLEDPVNRKFGTFDASTNGFLIPAAALIFDNAFTDNLFGANNATGFGFRVPDIVANLRVDQQWGFAGISAALQDVSGGYYGGPLAVNAVNANPGGGVANGHPPDRFGWAVAGGAKFNLQGGDAAGFNICYAEGAPGFCTNNLAFAVWNSNNSVGLGWIADGVFANGTQVELTRAWSALAFYEHIWNPKWRTSWFGGYVNIDYGSNATNLILQRTPGALNACGVLPVGGALSTVQLLPGNSCSPDFDFWEVGSRTQWNPVPQLDIGLEVLYSKRNTAFKGAAVVPASGARPPVLVLDDQDVWSAMFRWQRNFYP
jgi:Porin subfamily